MRGRVVHNMNTGEADLDIYPKKLLVEAGSETEVV